jgi:hypothetical protein
MAMQSVAHRHRQGPFPDDAHHAHGKTEAELRDLLRYIDRCARVFDAESRASPGTVCYEEYQDRGLDALMYCWFFSPWHDAYTVPFWVYTRHWIRHAMHKATQRYRRWEQPGSAHA